VNPDLPTKHEYAEVEYAKRSGNFYTFGDNREHGLTPPKRDDMLRYFRRSGWLRRAGRTGKTTGIKLSTFNIADLGGEERKTHPCRPAATDAERRAEVLDETGAASRRSAASAAMSVSVEGEEMWPLTVISSLQ
jgi:hypothetical protein